MLGIRFSLSPSLEKLVYAHGNEGYGAYLRLANALRSGSSISLQAEAIADELARALDLRNGGQLRAIVTTCAEVELLDPVAWRLDHAIALPPDAPDSTRAVSQQPSGCPAPLVRRGNLPLRERVFQRDSYTCQFCGARDRGLRCVTVAPAKKGLFTLGKAKTACSMCAQVKQLDSIA